MARDDTSTLMVSTLRTTDLTPSIIGGDRGPDGKLRGGPVSPLITILEAYRIEAWAARVSGRNPRDFKWRENLDLYWNRFDFSKKARWQSTAILPEVPQFVDRFAAAMTDALSGSDNGEFFTMEDPADAEEDITNACKKLLKVWLSEVGQTPNGHPISFLGMFPEFMKLGALMNIASICIWKQKPDGTGYVSLEPLDPRALWLDHTNRGMYRIRRIEIDKHEMLRLARETNKSGKKIYNLEQIASLASYLRVEMQEEQRRLTGTGTEQTSWRKPLTLDEYLCTIVDTDGQVLATNALVVVANERFIIRGPEKNPFWHTHDWIVTTPLITVPLSPYGRSYMENMGSLARLFNDLTNLMMDAVYTSAMKAFAINPYMLEDPTQADEGLFPNVTYRMQDGSDPDMFMKEINLGQIPPDVFQIWTQLKAELRESANFNELSTGQFAPKGRTSAAETMTVQQNSDVVLRDIARNVETRWIEPNLDLIWKTGLQHMKRNDPRLIQAVGPEMYAALYARRKELVKRPYTFKARGISTMLAKQAKFRNFMQMLAVLQQNQQLMQAFFAKYQPDRVLSWLLYLQEIDPTKFEPTQRELQMQALVQQSQALAGPMGQPSPQLGGPGQSQTAGPQTGAAGSAPQSAPGGGGGTPPQTAQDTAAVAATGGI